MTVFRFLAKHTNRFLGKHTNRIAGKNNSWRRLLTGPQFEYEIQFLNVRIKISLIVTLQPANQKKRKKQRIDR